ncbi:MAG: pyridoxamine 5'-phosphate oxidase family protein, partial [Clostridia bacterium]|nr:pyridoxamine 5'-phosphate oxidase family protein [Clostridia bacterium]
FLSEAGVFFFATVDGDKPRVRPFGFKMVYQDKLFFGIGKSKQSYKQLQTNPEVEVCACKGPAWIRIKGVAKFVEDAAASEEAYKVLPSLAKLYPNKADFGLLYLDNLDVEIADMQGGFEKVF